MNGGLYWDFCAMHRGLREGLAKAVRLSGDSIRSLGIDSFSNDFGLIDKNGELLSPVRCYRDARTTRHAEAIYARMSKERLYELTGNQIAPFNTLMQLAAMREAGQGFLLDNAAKLLFIPDLLSFFLTGRAVCERSIASVSQMYSFRHEDWLEEVLEAFALPRRLFGDLVMPGSVIGATRPDINRELGSLGFDVTAVCQHDTASAFCASPVPGDCLILSCGTWSLAGFESDSPIITRAGFLANIANEGGPRVRILRNVMGSWLLQELRRCLAERGRDFSFADLDRLAEQAKPFQFCIDVDNPVFFEPGDMPAKIAEQCIALHGAAPSSAGEFSRCIQESLAFKYRIALETLETLRARAFTAINLLGGGSKGSLICRYTASACNRTVHAGPEEASALGNALMQFIAHGALENLDEGRKLLARAFPPTLYQPENSGEWDNAFTRYRALLKL